MIERFKARHQIEDMVVVADAGMLSAANLTMLDEAGHRFIVGSRVTKAPIDLESHFRWHGDAFTDGQVIDTLTPKIGNNADNDAALKSEPAWDPATHPSSWRAVWAYSAKHATRDNKTLTARRTGPGPSSTGRSTARKPPVRQGRHQRVLPRRDRPCPRTTPGWPQGLRHEHPRPPDSPRPS